MSIEIEKAALESACKEMIETILFSLPNAFKGTIYRIGRAPELIAERITSGVLSDMKGGDISWGLPEQSEYNPPGKPWLEYRDDQGRPLEAMAWCVEKQKSWTSEDPRRDSRSVRLQVEGTLEDFHHMEPVLVRKSDLLFDMYSSLQYPLDIKEKAIWENSDFVVVAVIKIHFHPHTIRIESPETKVIKKLSRSLGTQLLSYQLRQDSLRTMQQLAKDRLNACNILADSLRNAIMKTGLIFSLVKQEIGYLRDQWEQLLLDELKERNGKVEAIERLDDILRSVIGETQPFSEDLLAVQKRFLELSLPPKKAENWVFVQIEERWRDLLNRCPQDAQRTARVWQTIGGLKKSLYFGQEPDIISRFTRIPEDLKKEWVDVLYEDADGFNPRLLEKMTVILGKPALCIPSRERSRKTLTWLKALAENMNQLERNTNFVLRQVLNGGDNGSLAGLLNSMGTFKKRDPLKKGALQEFETGAELVPKGAKGSQSTC
ncbi:MAG: hypothetical protein MUO52_06700 [Desulfobacterales bacterium]|nr:hypothetical protein [Desulfobacterales bacterium]